MKEPTLSAEEAKFVLVSCSAFINYALAKLARQETETDEQSKP
jgi:hypothetical protein